MNQGNEDLTKKTIVFQKRIKSKLFTKDWFIFHANILTFRGKS